MYKEDKNILKMSITPKRFKEVMRLLSDKKEELRNKGYTQTVFKTEYQGKFI